MAEGTPVSVPPIQLTTIDAEIYETPAGVISSIKEIILTNNNQTVGGLSVGVELQRRTASGRDFYIRTKDSTLNQLIAYQSELWELDLMLATGESLRGIATSSGIDVSLSVIQCTTNTDSDPTPLTPVTLSSAAVSDILTVDSGYVYLCKEILACNHNTNSVNSVELIRRTAASADYRLRASAKPTEIAKGATEVLHLNLILDEDEKLRATCSSSGVDVSASVLRLKKV